MFSVYAVIVFAHHKEVIAGRYNAMLSQHMACNVLYGLCACAVIVFAHHKEVMTGCEATLTQQWNQAHGPAHASTRPLRTVRLDGGTNETQRAEAVSAFQGDLATRVMFASMRAAGQGLNLTAARACVFAELDWVRRTHTHTHTHTNTPIQAGLRPLLCPQPPTHPPTPLLLHTQNHIHDGGQHAVCGVCACVCVCVRVCRIRLSWSRQRVVLTDSVRTPLYVCTTVWLRGRQMT